MQRLALLLVLAASLLSPAALAADMVLKVPVAATPPSPWDVAITGAFMSDYNFRGVTQSAHQPSIQAGLEPRYNFSSTLQAYVGVSAESIDFPNTATTEIDLYAGIRPTFGKLALDFGFWDYYYPGGKCFNTPAFCGTAGATPLPNGNLVKQNESFYEGYGKAVYTVTDNFNFGGSVWGTPSVLNSGASGIYYTGNIMLTAPTSWLPNGLSIFVSADIGWWQIGTTDAFYGVPAFYSLQELCELGRRPGFHLESAHARFALLSEQPEQGRLQCLHQRSNRDGNSDDSDQSVPASGLHLVRRGLHRQAFNRHDHQRNQIMRPAKSPAAGSRSTPSLCLQTGSS